ncbi:hypothetical protein BLOT_002791 [Blomia tropicalis]|nr:hypothetical protein BLOT_002791 [Blomia tropicalis]
MFGLNIFFSCDELPPPPVGPVINGLVSDPQFPERPILVVVVVVMMVLIISNRSFQSMFQILFEVPIGYLVITKTYITIDHVTLYI